MAKKLSQGRQRLLARNIQGGTGALTQRSLNAAKTSANQVAFNSVADPVGTFGGTKADFTNKKVAQVDLQKNNYLSTLNKVLLLLELFPLHKVSQL